LRGGNFIAGAGPAGLSAAWELAERGVASVVVERDAQVGGLSRTVSYKGFRFDIGGHRFFTKVRAVQRLWEATLEGDFLERARLSRIHYDGKFFDYPLRPWNALVGLGPWEAAHVLASWARAQFTTQGPERTFEQWVCRRFGRRLFEIFFKTYTEKVWGMPCSEISADWAAQRIKNLDLVKAVRNAVFGNSRASGQIVTTLIDHFHYPRLGPGMMWERLSERLAERGTPTLLETELIGVRHEGGTVREVLLRSADGSERREPAAHLISSLPLSALLRQLDPPPPPDVVAAGRRLRYRDFVTVVLIVGREQVFPDNWIYVHDPEVKVGRIQNYKNWSPEMVPDPGQTSLGLEYFVQQGDELWTASDEELLSLGAREMERIGILAAPEVVDGTVLRVPKAYPVYDTEYGAAVAEIRAYLEGFSNLQQVGRNGQHRYNNQDHSMVAGALAARNLTGEKHDVWAVNVEAEYHEEATEERLVPQAVSAASLEELLRSAFSRYDAVAVAGATAVIAAVGLFLATAVLLLHGGEPRGPTLSLLGHYLLGFEVSWPGALLGAAEAAVGGAALGWLTARWINRLIALHETALRRHLQLQRTVDPLDADWSSANP
jgi:protoporphyrinogen oxidase